MKKFLLALFLLVTAGLNQSHAAEPPEATDQPDITVVEDGTIEIILSGSDPENDPLTFTPGSVAHGTLTLKEGTDNTYIYEPAANYHGTDAFTFTAAAGTESDEGTVTINVTAVNDAPTFTLTIPEQNVADDAGVQSVDDAVTNKSAGPSNESTQNLTLSVSNDDNSLFSSQPQIDATTGTLTYTPAANADGTATVTVRLKDDGGTPDDPDDDKTTTKSFDISVTAANDAPTAESKSVEVEEEGSIDIVLSGADTDGDNLTYTPDDPAHGSLTLKPNTTRTYIYTPDANYSGGDQFTFTVSDGKGGTDQGTISITVTTLNDAPTVANAIGNVMANEDGASRVLDLTTTFSDVDGDALTIDVTNSNTGLLVASYDPATKKLTLNYVGNRNGDATITVTADDNKGGTVQTTFTVAVAPVNDEPSFTKGADQEVIEDAGAQNVTGWATNLDAGPNNESVQTLSFVVTNDNNALFSAQPAVDADGNLTYTPADNASGVATVSVRIKDNGGTANDGVDQSEVQTFIITINPVNDRPVATPQSVSTNEDISKVITPAGTDIENNTLTFEIATQPSHGAATANPDGTFTYTPTANYNGPDAFTFTAKDATRTSAPATVNITVNAVNDAPKANNDAATTNEDVAVSVNVLDNDTDPENNTLSVTAGTATNGTIVVNGDKTITFTPVTNFNGVGSFTYTLSDGNGGTDQGTVNITVNAVNDVPSGTNKTVTTSEDNDYTFITTDFGFSDGEGNALQAVKITTLPSAGSLKNNSTAVTAGSFVTVADITAGKLKFSPAANATGTPYASFTFQVQDNGGTANGGVDLDQSPNTMTINVTAVNDAPVAADKTASGPEDGGAITGNVTATDVDNTAAQLTYSVVTNVTAGQGVLTLNATTGAYSFTPAANFNGTATFTYRANDGTTNSNTATVTITVTPVNDAPVASNGTATGTEDGGPITGTVSASDVDGNTLTYSVVTGVTAAKGTLTLNATTGAYSFTPAAHFAGTVTFTYRANDGTTNSNTATVTITVTPVFDITDKGIILNELGIEVGANDQYFELYNSSTSPINLDCYTIILYSGSPATLYAIDLPDVMLAGRSWFVGAGSGTPILNGPGTAFTPNFNWNAGIQTLANMGASFKKYTKTGSSWGTGTDITGSAFYFNNGNNNKYSVFLFSSGFYVNGFSSAFSANTYSGLGTINNLTNGCGNFNINWSQVTKAENISAATGVGGAHGYYRVGDGICGGWDKLTSTGTPGLSNNPTNPNTVLPSILTTVEKITCSSTVSFKVTAVSDADAYPITVELYYDNGTPGVLDNGDVLQTAVTKTINSTPPLPYTGSFSIPSGQKVLLVYRTALGCVSKIVAPTSDAIITTAQYTICNRRIGAAITTATTDASTLAYAFPVTVNFFNNGAAIGSATISTPSATPVYSNLLTSDFNPTQISVQYVFSNCLTTQTVTNTASTFTALTGAYTTTQTSYCGKDIVVKLTAATGTAASAPDASTLLFPVIVEIHYDLNNDGDVDDAGEGAQGTPVSIPSASAATEYKLTVPDPSKTVFLVYKAPYTCYGKTVAPAAAAVTGSITTSETSYCNQRIDFKVTGGTVSAPAGSSNTILLPITAEMHYDADNDGVVDANEPVVGTPQQVTSFSNTVYSFTVPDPNQKVLILYKAPAICLSRTVVAATTATQATGGYTTSETNYCNKDMVVKVTGTTGTAVTSTLFPVTVEIHYDLNNDGDVNDAGESVVQGSTVSIPSADPNTEYKLTVPDPSKKVFLVYKASQYTCFSTTVAPATLTGGLTTTETRFCKTDITYAITGTTGTAASSALFPVIVEMHYDNDNDGIVDADEPVVGTPRELASFSNTTYSFTVPDPNKRVLLLYKAPYSCYSKTIALAATTTLLTNEQFVSDNGQPNSVPGKMQVRVTGLSDNTIGYNAGNVLPVTANLYWDLAPLGDPAGDELIETMQLTAFTETYKKFNHVFTLYEFNTKGENIVVTYTAASSCLTKRAEVLTAASILPVTFKSFNAVRKDDSKVGLTWTTAMEKDNRGFYIQRNVDNAGWKDVGFVFSLADGGNSSSDLNYTFSDPNTYKGVSQYRILQVDLNGLGHYSGIRSVGGSKAAGHLRLGPNPSTTGAVTLFFDTDGNRDVMVADVSGRMVQQYRSITTGSFTMKNLPNGFYTVQVRDNTAGTTATEKFVITMR